MVNTTYHINKLINWLQFFFCGLKTNSLWFVVMVHISTFYHDNCLDGYVVLCNWNKLLVQPKIYLGRAIFLGKTIRFSTVGNQTWHIAIAIGLWEHN